MATIHLKLTTGEEMTISKSFYGRTGETMDESSANVQSSFIFKELVAIGTDQGKKVNIAQIVYTWVVA